MRSKSHVKIITAQIENLEDLKIQLQSILDYVNNVIKEGHSWIEEKDDKFSFLQMNQFMTNETFNCIQKCEEISDMNNEIPGSRFTCKIPAYTTHSMTLEVSSSEDKETKYYKTIQSRLDETYKSNLLHEKKIKKIDKKVKTQDINLQTIQTQMGEMEKKTIVKFEDLETELHAASDFMSHLQTQNKCLENKLKNNEISLIEIQKQLTVYADQQKQSRKCVSEMKSQFSFDFSQLSDKVEAVSIKLENFLSSQWSTPIGFHAFGSSDLESRSDFQQNERLTCFKDIRQDFQNNFDPSTGIFTAHSHGLYMFHLKIEMYEDQDMFTGFSICLKKQRDSTETILNNVYSQTTEVPGLVFGFTPMDYGDQIYIKCHLECVGVVLSKLSEFMCILLA